MPGRPSRAPAGVPAGPDLGHHGDAEVGAGLVDLEVNVRRAPMPPWLAGPLTASLGDLAGYPDPAPARVAVAARHRRPPEEVLLTAGAAEGFVLIAQALRRVRRPVVVHPQLTEPEAALLAAGHRVRRALMDAADGFRLDPTRVPADADLVMVGNPTNPTSVLHPATTLATLARPGRVLVVDEAFADTTVAPGVPGEPESLANRRDLPGLLVLRSLTKTWGLAGLADLPQVRVAGHPASAFVLLRIPGADRIRLALRERGWAVRRGDTFPGLGPDWLRVAVRDPGTTDAFTDTLAKILEA